jgi:hypothetical protein
VRTVDVGQTVRLRRRPTKAWSQAETEEAEMMQSRWCPRKALNALVLTFAGALTACGVPPALTSGIIRGEQKYFSFDNVIGTQEPRDVPRIIEGLEGRPGVFGIDTIEKIETKFISAGGICSRRGSIIECYIERSRISRDCFQSKCSLVQKEWTVRIRAPEKTGPIRPTVKIELRSSRSNLTSKNVETKNV